MTELNLHIAVDVKVGGEQEGKKKIFHAADAPATKKMSLMHVM